jgi:hypothetical protein
LALAVLLGGCSTVKGWFGSGDSARNNDAPSAAEMKELCEMHRKMATMPRESQDALLESHMKSAHGSTDRQAMNQHRQLMLRECRAG